LSSENKNPKGFFRISVLLGTSIGMVGIISGSLVLFNITTLIIIVSSTGTFLSYRYQRFKKFYQNIEPVLVEAKQKVLTLISRFIQWYFAPHFFEKNGFYHSNWCMLPSYLKLLFKLPLPLTVTIHDEMKEAMCVFRRQGDPRILEDMIRDTKDREIDHIGFFVFLILLAAPEVVYKEWFVLTLVSVSNVFINVFPIMLERRHRFTLEGILKIYRRAKSGELTLEAVKTTRNISVSSHQSAVPVRIFFFLLLILFSLILSGGSVGDPLSVAVAVGIRKILERKSPLVDEREKLMKQGLPWIRIIILRMGIFDGVLYDDAFAAGLDGLWDAIKKHDSSKGASFQTMPVSALAEPLRIIYDDPLNGVARFKKELEG